MKGHKGHHHRKASGGMIEKGVKAADASPHDIYAGERSNVVKEARERKHGGKVHGEKSKHRADRKPRKSGGRAGSNFNPLSSAHAGTEPKAHKSGDYS